MHIKEMKEMLCGNLHTALSVSDQFLPHMNFKKVLIDFHGNQIAIAMKHYGSVYNVAFTSNGATILTNSDSGIRLWNVVTLDNFLKSDHLAPLEKLLLTDQQKKKYLKQ